jgi:hypothetical protein
VARAVTHVQELNGIQSIELTDEEEIVVLYDAGETTPETIATAFRFQGFPIEIKP